MICPVYIVVEYILALSLTNSNSTITNFISTNFVDLYRLDLCDRLIDDEITLQPQYSHHPSSNLESVKIGATKKSHHGASVGVHTMLCVGQIYTFTLQFIFQPHCLT